MSFALKLLLTLRHGQATAKQGFNLVNTNMNQGTVIAKCLVKDHLKPHTIEITSSMIKAFRGTHMKYRFYFEEEKSKP